MKTIFEQRYETALRFTPELVQSISKISDMILGSGEPGRGANRKTSIAGRIRIEVSCRDGSQYSLDNFDDLIVVIKEQPYSPKSVAFNIYNAEHEWTRFAFDATSIHILHVRIEKSGSISDIKEEIERIRLKFRAHFGFLHSYSFQLFLPILISVISLFATWIIAFSSAFFGAPLLVYMGVNLLAVSLAMSTFSFSRKGLQALFPRLEFEQFGFSREAKYRGSALNLLAGAVTSIVIPLCFYFLPTPVAAPAAGAPAKVELKR